MSDRLLNTNSITKENFEHRFKEIERSLQDAHFIGVDVEFTGAPRKNSTWKLDGTNNLETPERVYANFKEDAKSFIIIQLGVTAVHFDSKANKYEATCYTFHVFPQSLPASQKTFEIQGAVMELLTSLDFDFNKVVYEGISYLSQVEEKIFRKELYTGSVVEETSRPLSMDDERIIKDKCSIISTWECTAKVGDSMELEDIDLSRKLIVYMLIKEIHSRFSTLWTFRTENDLDPSNPGVRIEKLSDLKYSELQSQSVKYQILENELIKHFAGISQIFNLLVVMKKPIVASGALFDMMMIFHHLHRPLPDNYVAFKKELNELLPHVYDAKHIAYELRRLCQFKGAALNKANGLEILDQYFRPGQGAELPAGQPVIQLSGFTNDAPTTIGQDSGWDSYYTSCCFLRMMLFFAKIQNKDKGSSTIQSETTISKHFAAEFKNCFHVGPATVDFIRLDGLDPTEDRPQSLLLIPDSPEPIGLEVIYDDLAQVVRDSITIKMRSGGRARVTVNSRMAAQAIVRRCREGGDYVVCKDVKSMVVRRTVITGSLVGITSILLWKLYKLVT